MAKKKKSAVDGLQGDAAEAMVTGESRAASGDINQKLNSVER